MSGNDKAQAASLEETKGRVSECIVGALHGAFDLNWLLGDRLEGQARRDALLAYRDLAQGLNAANEAATRLWGILGLTGGGK